MHIYKSHQSHPCLINFLDYHCLQNPKENGDGREGVTGHGFRPLVYQDEPVTLDFSDIIGRVTYVGHMHVDETEKGLLLMTVSSGHKVDVFKYWDPTYGSVLIVPACGDCFCSALSVYTLAIYNIFL